MLQEGQQLEGTVKHFNTEKGWGFILIPGEDSLFVHWKSILSKSNDPGERRVLKVGQNVRFMVMWNEVKQKFYADDVEVI